MASGALVIACRPHMAWLHLPACGAPRIVAPCAIGREAHDEIVEQDFRTELHGKLCAASRGVIHGSEWRVVAYPIAGALARRLPGVGG